MLQRLLIAVLLLFFVSGVGLDGAYAFESEIEAFEYTAGGESLCGEQWNIDEHSCKALQCGTPMASLLCPIDIDAQDATLQAVFDGCDGDADCFHAHLRVAQQQYAAEAAATAWLDPATMGAGAASLAKVGVEMIAAVVSSVKPLQMHHFATNKNQVFTAKMDEIARKYGLRLDDAWNTARLPQQGRHASQYHQWVLNEMNKIDKLAQGDQKVFLRLFEVNVKAVVRANPDMLYSGYWR